jgi:hypothetical protein
VKTRRTILTVAATLAAVCALLLNGFAVYLVLHPRRSSDQVRVWSFTPAAAISEQVRRDDMSAEGRFLYLASFPKVESKQDFNQTCSAVTVDTSILGCYLRDTKRIYLYHETDARLDGTEEVMGAHEMLRAAWDRMGAAEHKRLLVALHTVLSTNHTPDLQLKERMATIRHNDSANYDAELYATIGTDVPSVGPVLAKSYSEYFSHRSTVTALSKHSVAYLVALKKKVDALVSTMNTLGDTIDADVKNFNNADAQLGADVDAFNARARRPGGFPTEHQFDVVRAALIARDDALEATANQINGQVDTFNADLGKLEALDKTALSLVKSLNIDLEPLPDVITA